MTLKKQLALTLTIIAIVSTSGCSVLTPNTNVDTTSTTSSTKNSNKQVAEQSENTELANTSSQAKEQEPKQEHEQEQEITTSSTTSNKKTTLPLMAIYGVELKADALLFSVPSNGCTDQSHFNLTVTEVDDTRQVSLTRKQQDLCRAMTRLVNIEVPFNATSIAGSQPFVILNPFISPYMKPFLPPLAK